MVYAPFCAFASLIIAQKSTPTTAQMSKALCFTGMKEIYLESPTDDDFRQLENQNIRSIRTNGDNSSLTDAALRSISMVVGLEEADLEWAVNITDVGLEYLQNSSSLKYLDVSFCGNLTEIGIEKLRVSISGLHVER